MLNDLLLFNKIINLKKKSEIKKNSFFWIYPFTNENIRGYYSSINFKDKNVLTVTSSGDHALNALLYGASTIECFDVNPLAKYYVELKIAAIKSLSLEEFILFFYNKNLLKKQKYYLNKETYENKIRKNLDDVNRDFWDYILNKYTPEEIYKSYVFSNDFLDLKGLIESNAYLNSDNYNKIKEILKTKTIKYYDINIKELHELNKTFDIIILSNIPAFLKDIYDKDALKQLKEMINNLTKEESIVVINYFYNNLITECYDESIYDILKVNEYFPKKDYEYIYFESSDNLGLNNKVRKIFFKRDKVLITKDKKNIKC